MELERVLAFDLTPAREEEIEEPIVERELIERVWGNDEEFIRLIDTKTIRFIKHSNIPFGHTATYLWVV